MDQGTYGGQIIPHFSTIPQKRRGRKKIACSRQHHTPSCNIYNSTFQRPVRFDKKMDKKFHDSWKFNYKHSQFESTVKNITSNKYVIYSRQILVQPHSEIINAFRFPDFEIPWSSIVEVIFSQTESTKCPICLCSPTIPRMGCCGHVYCWPCALQYIDYDNNTPSRKCAICETKLYRDHLKRVSLINCVHPRLGMQIELVLMCRYKDIIIPDYYKETELCKNQLVIPSKEYVCAAFSRILISTPQDIMEILNRDRQYLENALSESYLSSSKDPLFPYLEEAYQNVLGEINETKALKDCKQNNEHKLSNIIDTSDSHFVYYQSSNADDIYLHSINWKCLLHNYKEINFLPVKISANVVDLEHYTMSIELRKRFRFLNHLPIGRSFCIVELDLVDFLSQQTLNDFSDLLLSRANIRQQRFLLDVKLTKAKESAENRIQSLPEGCKLIAPAKLEDEIEISQLYESDITPIRPHMQNFGISFANVSRLGARDYLNKDRIANFPKLSTRHCNKSKHFNAANEQWPTLGESLPLNTPPSKPILVDSQNNPSHRALLSFLSRPTSTCTTQTNTNEIPIDSHLNVELLLLNLGK